jgi:hypothetical protein
VKTPDFSSRGPRPAARPWEAVLLAVALALITLSSYKASSSYADSRRARLAYEAETREATSLQERLRRLEAGPSVGVAGLAARVVTSMESPPSRVLAALTALMPPDVRLDGVGLSYGVRLDVEARVVARRAESYDLFLKRLAESPVFEAIVPGSESRQGETRASLRMTFRPEVVR